MFVIGTLVTKMVRNVSLGGVGKGGTERCGVFWELFGGDHLIMSTVF